MTTEKTTEATFGESRLTDELGDRELLDLAAKAAGMFVLPEPWPDSDGWFFCMQHDEPKLHFRDHKNSRRLVAPWSPLTDDGDALRLAVKLNLLVDCYGGVARPLPDSIGWQEGITTTDPERPARDRRNPLRIP